MIIYFNRGHVLLYAKIIVVTDKEGIPWDIRIHSSGKTFLKSGKNKGCWKLARGVDEGLVNTVKAELMGGTPAPAPAPAPVPAPLEETEMSWTALLQAVSINSIEPAVTIAACLKFGVANIGVLQDSPAIVPLVAKELGLL